MASPESLSVLAVDGESAIRGMAARALSRMFQNKFSTETAANKVEARRKPGGKEYHVALTNLNIKSPKEGLYLTRYVIRYFPRTAVIGMSGNLEAEVLFRKHGVHNFLQKPPAKRALSSRETARRKVPREAATLSLQRPQEIKVWI